MKTHSRNVLAAVACAALAASLAACGGGGGDPGDDTATGTANSTATTTANSTANSVPKVTIRWPGGNVPVYYNDAGRPANTDKAAAIGAIQNAAALWSVACGANVYYAGERSASVMNAAVVIKWGAPTDAVAVADTRLASDRGNPGYAVITIDNDRESWGVQWYVGTAQYIQNAISHVVLHELGHAMGLPHNDDPTDVMYPSSRGDSGINDADSYACKVY